MLMKFPPHMNQLFGPQAPENVLFLMSGMSVDILLCFAKLQLTQF